MPTAPATSSLLFGNSSKSDAPSALSHSVTSLIQHSILQACNENISFNHKLQVLGVLCLTIDDKQEEFVVKVNNTLKRSSPIPSSGSQRDPRVFVSSPPASHHPSQPSEGVNLSVEVDHSRDSQVSPLPSTSALSEPFSSEDMPNGRKTHGRKASHPVKVQHVIDEGDLISSEEDPENYVTVIPTDPDQSTSEAAPVSQGQTSSAATSSPIAGSQAPEARQLQGSARRKPAFQSRVENLDTDEEPGTIRALLLAGPRSKTNDAHRPDSPLSYQGSMMDDEEEKSRAGGLSLPIVIGPKDDYELAANGNVDGALDFSTRPSEQRSEESRMMDLALSRSLGLKSYFSKSAFDSPPRPDPYRLPFGGLPYLPPYGPPPPDTGLSIQYTSTGPITVTPNGKNVSQSALTKVKDIIMYDDSTSPASQKGSRIETGDYMLDSLGYESSSRKRRRRAPDESLTAEEITEYLGFSSNMANGIFKCKFCDEEVQELTRYLQHTLSAHNAYICHQCGKSFTTKSSLLRHRPIHTGMRRYACSICKKTFYRKDKCRAHIKRHLGITSDSPNIDMKVEHCTLE